MTTYSSRLGFRLGFMWNCPWRIEWRSRHEYWDRCQFGPFYVLLRRKRD